VDNLQLWLTMHEEGEQLLKAIQHNLAVRRLVQFMENVIWVSRGQCANLQSVRACVAGCFNMAGSEKLLQTGINFNARLTTLFWLNDQRFHPDHFRICPDLVFLHGVENMWLTELRQFLETTGEGQPHCGVINLVIACSRIKLRSSLRQQAIQHSAICFAQNLWKSRRARRRAAASVEIQKNWRSFTQRTALGFTQRSLARRTAASLKIQKKWRGFTQRSVARHCIAATVQPTNEMSDADEAGPRCRYCPFAFWIF